MAFPDTTPRKGDSENNLLFKIAQELSEQNGGAFPPMLGDSDNNLLRKILQLLILGGAGGGGALATCSAALAACQAIFVPQDMQWNWTPPNLNFGEMNGYGIPAGTPATFPGITSLTFRGTTLAGLSWNSKANLASLTFANLVTIPAGISIVVNVNPVLTTISFPVLTTSLTAVTLNFSGNVALTSFSAPLLTSMLSGISLNGNTALISLSLPSLVAGPTGTFTCNGNTAMTTVSFPNYLPQSGVNQNFGVCALTQASVDHVLARCVANPAYVSGTVTLNGGTNSTPSAAGLVDKGILVGRGVTVLNN